MTELETLEGIIRRRRATRHFRSDPLPEGLAERLIDTARWAPSGYNLQPTHFTLVTEARLREQLCPACMGQRQIREAPAIIILSGDSEAAAHHLEPTLRMDREVNAISPDYEKLLRRMTPLAFGRGPLGIGWFWKATLLPLVRLARPIPSIPAVHRRYWLAKQVMLCAMNLMLAAEAAGLASVPMEGFDETRVRKVLRIPRRHVPVVVIALGYADPQPLVKTRLPLEQVLHREAWQAPMNR